MNKPKNTERGAAMVEYAVLLSSVLIVVLMGTHILGLVIESTLADIETASAESREAQTQQAAAVTLGGCPTGWDLVPDTQTKKNGKSVDANGDGSICQKQLPGNGNGNTNNNQNVKDNNN